MIQSLLWILEIIVTHLFDTLPFFTSKYDSLSSTKISEKIVTAVERCTATMIGFNLLVMTKMPIIIWIRIREITIMTMSLFNLQWLFLMKIRVTPVKMAATIATSL